MLEDLNLEVPAETTWSPCRLPWCTGSDVPRHSGDDRSGSPPQKDGRRVSPPCEGRDKSGKVGTRRTLQNLSLHRRVTQIRRSYTTYTFRLGHTPPSYSDEKVESQGTQRTVPDGRRTGREEGGRKGRRGESGPRRYRSHICTLLDFVPERPSSGSPA